MYKVVIIDDEKRIVNGLQKILNWTEMNCEIAGVTYNGKEGLTLVSSLKPDIVLTDIRMPHMDGLEMIKALNEQGCTARFIMLSGYAEFEYAKRGIEIGVSSYLLKPINEIELANTIKELIAGIEKERETNSRINILEKSTSRLLQFREHLLKDLVIGAIDDAGDIQDIFESLHIPIYETNFACALVELENLVLDASDNTSQDIKEFITQRYSGRAIVFHYSQSQYAMIINNKELLDDDTALKTLNSLQNTIFEKYKYPVTIGTGRIFNSLEEISGVFNQALYAINFKAIKGKNIVISYPEASQYPYTNFLLPDNMIQNLEDSIYTMDYKKAASLIHRFFYILVENGNLTPLNLQLQCIGLLLEIARKMNSLQVGLANFIGKDILSIEAISRYKTVDEIKNWMLNTIRSIIEIKESQSKNAVDIIKNIKDYISEHIDEDITLNSLAEQFFMNPYYLSTLFKKKTGQAYSKYLTDVRIDKAKELLMFTDYKINEISEKVGYCDVKYFQKLFTKSTGCSPSKYKLKLPK